VRLLIEAGTPVVTIYGKTSMLHVKEVLRCTPEENLAMIGDTVRFPQGPRQVRHLRRRTLL
jgi:2-isopropylmalate synthase